MARDREKFNAAWRRWYANNAKRKYEWQRRRLLEMRSWWRELKSTKSCSRCDERTPECLQFHHRDPKQKEFDLGLAVGSGWAKKRILAEMERCIVLCANCHLIHHWEERQRKGSG